MMFWSNSYLIKANQKIAGGNTSSRKILHNETSLYTKHVMLLEVFPMSNKGSALSETSRQVVLNLLTRDFGLIARQPSVTSPSSSSYDAVAINEEHQRN